MPTLRSRQGHVQRRINITEVIIVNKLRELYKCGKCGNVVEIVAPAGPPIVCCGENMQLLEPGTVDASLEKHVPVVEETEGGVVVKVGSVPHPMEEKHYIMFIEVLTESQVLRAELKPGQEPSAMFKVDKKDIIEVREYCNLHGLWKA